MFKKVYRSLNGATDATKSRQSDTNLLTSTTTTTTFANETKPQQPEQDKDKSKVLAGSKLNHLEAQSDQRRFLRVSKKNRKRLSAFVNRLQTSTKLSIGHKLHLENNKSPAPPNYDEGEIVKYPNGCREPTVRKQQAKQHQLQLQAPGCELPTQKTFSNKYHDQPDEDEDEYLSAEEYLSTDTSKHTELDQENDSVYGRPPDCDTMKPSATKSHQLEALAARTDDSILPEELCDIPTFLHTNNADAHLIHETRRLLRERYVNNPDSFYDSDYNRMLNDDWTVTRFLLRRRLDPKRTAKLMEECGRFRRQYKMSEVKLWEFPTEFHRAGGLFKYAPDRVGNMTMYMRVKMYRRVPEISDVFKAFILCVLEECDTANNGRGTAVIFDLSGCGLQNVDLSFLSWLLSSFRNYCPKGVSYIIVYNLPWILNATCKLAMTWMSANNKRALRFCHGKEIENFIAKENLPDYCGGTSTINYKSVPKGSRPAIEVCEQLDMTRDQALKIRELFKEYLKDDDEEHEQPEKVREEQPAKEAAKVDGEQPETEMGVGGGAGGAGEEPLVNFVSQASKFIAH